MHTICDVHCIFLNHFWGPHPFLRAIIRTTCKHSTTLLLFSFDKMCTQRPVVNTRLFSNTVFWLSLKHETLINKINKNILHFQSKMNNSSPHIQTENDTNSPFRCPIPDEILGCHPWSILWPYHWQVWCRTKHRQMSKGHFCHVIMFSHHCSDPEVLGIVVIVEGSQVHQNTRLPVAWCFASGGERGILRKNWVNQQQIQSLFCMLFKEIKEMVGGPTQCNKHTPLGTHTLTHKQYVVLTWSI